MGQIRTKPPTTAESFLRRISEDDVEFLFAMFVDMHGKPCAKLIPAQAAEQFLFNGVGFAGHAAGAMGQTPADPDLTALPDVRSYTLAPWQPGLAIVQTDIHVDGRPWPYSPRMILQRSLEKARNQGLTLMTGAEAEYCLVNRTGDGGIAVADSEDTSRQPCYDVGALTRNYHFLTTASRHLNDMGWGNYANDHEDGNGQYEQNFEYADALTTADRIIVFRHLIHSLAHQNGVMATFMPKPFTGRSGNGLHLHLSLWDDRDRPLFEDGPDVHGLGLSDTGYQFVGGILEHAAGLTALTCPTVNSYKRIGPRDTVSGAAWAPVYATFGGNNRTQMIRVPDQGRIEVRSPDGSANPYLAMTGLLAAGLDGIEHGSDPGEPNRSNLFTNSVAAEQEIPSLPGTLSEALAALGSDSVLRGALGKIPGGEYVDYFHRLKQAEVEESRSQVSPWEVERYLTIGCG